GEGVIVGYLERDVMDGPGAEALASRWAVGVVQEHHGLARDTYTELQKWIGAVQTGFAESEGFDEEALFFVDFPHRQQRTMEAAYRFGLSDFMRAPAFAGFVRIFDHLDFQAGRMCEVQERLAESFVDVAMPDPVAVQVIDPERQRPLGNGVDNGLDLAGAGTSVHPFIREGGHDG